MKRTDTKSHCVINYALETFGDTWTLLIVRDIVFWGKKTYGEFLHSDEHISTNILANRLALLEKRGIIVKTPCPDDKRKEVYTLSECGLDLIPILMEMSNWSAHHDGDTTASLEFADYICRHRQKVFRELQQAVREGRSLFGGPDSVAVSITRRLKIEKAKMMA